MKLNINIALALLSLLLVACQRPEDHTTELTAVLEEFAHDYAAAYDLKLFQLQVGGTTKEPLLIVGFESTHRWKLEQARFCLVDGAQALLKRAQHIMKVEPSQVDITLIFKGEDPTLAPVTSISHAYLSSGRIYYSVYDSEEVALKKIYRETYSEAEREIKNARQQRPFRLEPNGNPGDLPLPASGPSSPSGNGP